MGMVNIDLVRCGECKWWNEETHGCNRNPSVNAWWETDYCSYGERNEDFDPYQGERDRDENGEIY